MDLQNIIRSLLEERSRLDSVIASLEAFEKAEAGAGKGKANPRRRGRKFMSLEERHSVSERMRKYWENYRRAPGRRRPPAPPPADQTVAH